jgi:hypothetical protein
MGDVSLLEMRMEGQSLLNSGESSGEKYSSRVGRARLANQNARKQVGHHHALHSTVTTATSAATALAAATLAAATLAAATLAAATLAAATLAAATLAAATLAAATLAAATLVTPPRPMPHQPCRRRHPSFSNAAPLVTASVRMTLAVGRHPLTYPHIRPASHPPALCMCREWASSLSGLTTLLWSSRVKDPPW